MGEADLRLVCELLTLPSSTVEAIAISALREWWRAVGTKVSGGLPQLSVHGELGRRMIPMLVEAHGRAPLSGERVNQCKEVFFAAVNAENVVELRPIAELLARLVRAGILIAARTGDRHFPLSYFVTTSGERFLGGDDDHPLLPEYLERVAARCPNLPDDVLEHLRDARECFSHDLLRPSLVLLGLAFEAAVDHVVEARCAKSAITVSVDGWRAARRIDELRKLLPTLFPHPIKDLDDRAAASRALDFADDLRRRRNDGSHTRPRFPFDRPEEVDELIVSAGRKLPDLWRIQSRP